MSSNGCIQSPPPLIISTLLLILVLLGRDVFCRSELVYTVLEELQIGSFVGDVKADSSARLSPEVADRLRFTFLMPASIPVEIDEITGHISTSGRIDREAICRNTHHHNHHQQQQRQTNMASVATAGGDEPHCHVWLDVAVHPVAYFQMIKVLIQIQDINDNSPEFVPSSIVREISESSQVGTGFVVPTARDVDTVKYGVNVYRLTDGAESGLFGLNITRKLDGSTEVSLPRRITLLSHDRRKYRHVIG